MLAIYHWEPNANSGKPMLAAFEKGVDFESHYVDMLNFEQHEPDYLFINPNGTLPTLIHDGRSVPESTAMMEYIDGAFEGPPLRPADPFERWRMRWWCRMLDQFIGPSVSMFGWHYFVSPAVRRRDPAELQAKIERIPLKERRVAWSKAIHGTFSVEEMTESKARIQLGARAVEAALSGRQWLAGASYSLADIVGFNMLAGLPMIHPDAAGDATTPHLMQWLRVIYARPAVKKLLALARNDRMRSYPHLERTPG